MRNKEVEDYIMLNHDYKQNAYYLIYLIRCILNQKIPSEERLSKIDHAQLYEVALDHSLTAICAYALESAGVNDKKFYEAKNRSIRDSILFDAEIENIQKELDRCGIWHMPLKGAVIKKYYPSIGMRQMCDVDILFDKQYVQKVKEIMSDLEYELKQDDSGHDIVFIKKPVFNIEMHTALFGIGHSHMINDYYDNIFDKLIRKKDSSYEYCFSNEDFYIYMIAHENKHYYLSGTGLRGLVDIYTYNTLLKDPLDWEYIYSELEKLGIKDFEADSRNLAMKLFEGRRLTNDEKKMLDYYIFSGTHGNLEYRVENALIKNQGSKLSYIFSRLFIDKEIIEKQYPTFNKYKVLIPFLPIYRLIMSTKASRKSIFNELKEIIKL